MAFVRWRGLCAQLLTTVYDKGRSRQVLLANLHSGYTVPTWIRTQVQEQFPLVSVDWSQIEEALAKGPLGTPELTQEQWDCLRVEQSAARLVREPSPGAKRCEHPESCGTRVGEPAGTDIP